MLRSPLFWRVYAGSVGLILVALLAALALASHWLEAAALARLEGELEESARIVQELAGERLAEPLDPRFEERLRQLGRGLSTRITLIHVSGRVVADSEEDPGAMDDHSERAEIVAARARGGPATALRRSDTSGGELLYFALPVHDAADALVGFVRTARGVHGLRAATAPLRDAVALAAFVGALLALAIWLPFARHIRQSLRELSSVAESMAAGSYHERLHFPAKGELGRVGQAFDAMAAELERRVETVTTDRNRVRAILAGMVEGVVAIDRDEQVVHVNDVARRLLRIGARDIGGLRIWEATRLKEVREILVQAMEERRAVQGELSTGGSDSPILELRAGPLTDHRQDVVGAVLVINDVTELRRLEGIRRDFVANVSHELKTPLTAIRGMIETILDDPDMPPQTQHRFLGRMEEQTQRLSTLVSDLLTLSRLESHVPRTERERLDLVRVVSASVQRFAGQAASKSIDLSASLPDREIPVLGDEEELREVVDNLVDNAIKYTPEGGKVRAGLSVLPAREDGGVFARLEVTDTGIGIEPVDQERVFERFYRVDKARSRELGGTGLGLAIVKHVALEMGGRVSLQSVPGVGTSFRVDLPMEGRVQA